jgi:hypothetical protein
MRNTAYVAGGKPIAVWANNPLDVFYDIHGKKKEVLLFYSVSDTIGDKIKKYNLILHIPCA